MTFGFALLTVGTVLVLSGYKNRSVKEILSGITTPVEGGAGSGFVSTILAGAGEGVSSGVTNLKGGSVKGHPELKPGISAVVATVLARFPGLSVGSTMRAGDTDSFHSEGRAADIVGSTQEMNKAAKWINRYLANTLTEGIHNPGLSVDSKHHVPSSFWGSEWANHADHIHLAV